MRTKKRWGLAITLAMVMLVSTACSSTNGGAGSDNETSTSGNGSTPASAKKITLGFSQVGAESGWRAANTKSIQDSAKNRGMI